MFLEVLDLGHWNALVIGLHLPTLRAGIHHQRFGVDLDRLRPHDRFPTGAHLGCCRSNLGDGFLTQLAAVEVVQEETHIVDIALLPFADAAQLTCFHAGDHFFSLADPFWHQMRRANYNSRIRIQQLDNPQADGRFAATHFPLGVGRPV